MTYREWAQRHPQAARDLANMLAAAPWSESEGSGKPEAWAQQQVRLKIAQAGAMSWRNNVGATKAKCPDCGAPQQPVRYGLANDSAKLNEQIKSSDLILAIPRVIKPEDVGRTVAQFGGVEVKPPGWQYTGKGREAAQAAWLALVTKLGGYACFSTGEIEL